LGDLLTDLANFFTQGYQQTKSLAFVGGVAIFWVSGGVVFFLGSWDPADFHDWITNSPGPNHVPPFPSEKIRVL